MRSLLILLGTCFLLQPIPLVRGAEPPVVARVTGGEIAGAPLPAGGAVFKGIPYARPPVGELRWREPTPVQAWPGVRRSTEFSAVCMQGPALLPPGARMSEDCLYLNVWAPEWPAKSRKPVMVWVTGGGNFGGGIAPTQPYGDGAPLARHGVVVVSFNYRLGTFGFFAHPALTSESFHHSSGNQGILDQIAALQWVRANISRFGGDPDTVTIFGESAGAHDASVLMTSPLAKGLFKRVIAQSGSVVLGDPPQSLAEAEKRGTALTQRWPGLASMQLSALRAVPAADIVKTDPDLIEHVSGPGPAFPNLGIVVDGFVFPESPITVFMQGREHDVALLHGANSRDGIPGPDYDGPSDLNSAIESAYGPLAERAKRLYVGADDPVYGTQSNQWSTDTSFRCPAAAQLLWHANAGHPAYQYEFAVGAAAYHAKEVAFVFGTTSEPQSEAMQRYWTQFAKTGDPNEGPLPSWPRFTADSRAYLQFTNAAPVAGRGLRRAQCDVFIENVSRTSAH